MSGIDRLRAIAGAWDEWGLGGTLTEIADQIERELDRHDEPDSTDKGARLPYVTDEDREALEWVRKYGGIGCAQTMAAKLGDTLSWVRERAGIGEDEVVDYDELLDALDRRLMPEGMEWMLWDDGKPVTYDDAPDDVIGVYLALDGSGYVLMTDLPDQLMSESSERVRRPAVPADVSERHVGGYFQKSRKVANSLTSHSDASDVSMSAYDLLPEDEREAIAWVRERGGLDHVRAEWSSRVPRDLYERRRQRLLDHIAECETALGRRNHRIEELGRRVGDLTRENAELRKRAMPEGCEWLIEAWPKFDDDAPVKLGDMALIDGDVDMVEAVQIWIHGKPVIYGDNGSQQLEKGERVKRIAVPSVPAGDGEPLEVGQTVWDVESGEELKVEELCDVGLVHLLTRDGVSRYVYPDQLTHQRPVLGADGVPIETCQKMWRVRNGEEVRVSQIDRGEHPLVTYIGEDGLTHEVTPDGLTHAKPEPPDSWQHIEEDAGCTATKYNERRGTIFTTKQQVARDLVRRCRALAERGE